MCEYRKYNFHHTLIVLCLPLRYDNIEKFLTGRTSREEIRFCCVNISTKHAARNNTTFVFADTKVKSCIQVSILEASASKCSMKS